MTADLAVADGRIQIHSLLSGEEDRTLACDAMSGLTREFKELPPKHFYDHEGAILFDKICELPEYYPTRTERAILESSARAIVALTGAQELVELGSGTAAKTRILLRRMEEAGMLRRYIPVDVTEQMIRSSARELTLEHPSLHVHGIVGDFERHLSHIPPPEGARIVLLLGGTIGNLTPEPRREFLRMLRPLLGDDGHLLLGTDLVKDVGVLEAAYNDGAGVTAAFNLNLLHVLNRELGANFDVDAFEHVAFFEPQEEWIEMRLKATRKMEVDVRALGITVAFDEGEEMRTEISSKFTRQRLAADLAAAGLVLTEQFSDSQDLYSLNLIRAL